MMDRLQSRALLLGDAAGALLPVAAHAQTWSGRSAHEWAATLDEVVVTAERGGARTTFLPTQILAGEALVQRRRGTLGETLEGLPRVRMDSYGGGVSRPVIRGQSLPRIEILSDGANLFDASAVSPDHGITTDPLLLDAIEIQRGPAAIRYGGNAANGAVNLIDGKIPKVRPDGGADGAFETRYGTGDGETTVVGRVSAGVGDFVFHLEGAARSSDDYGVHSAYGEDRLKDSFADCTAPAN